jgi:hypothetical protein
MKKLLMAASMCVAFAGCGGSSATPPAAPAVSSGTGTLSFSILVPASATAAGNVRRPAYVSPSTQSVSFKIGSGATQVVALTPGSTSCPLSGGAYTCTATASVPAGSYQVSVATYASANASGAALSQNSFAVVIVADQINPVNVTLNGVASSFALSANPSSVTEGTPSTVTVTWTALDASGNTIIGPGSIINAAGTVVAPALTDTDTTDFSIGTPASNSWTVSYDGAVTSSPVTFSVANTGVTSGSTVASVISAGQRMFVANVGTNNSVSVLNPPYTGAATVITNGMPSSQAPFIIAVNASFEVFVPNTNANEVNVYAPPYTGAPTVTIPVTFPRGVVLDATNNLFVSTATGVQEFAPPYTGAAIATIADNHSPLTLAVDASDDVFIQNEDGTDSVSVFTPPYAAPTATISTSTCTPQCLEQVGQFMLVLPGTSEVVFPNDGYATTAYASPYSINSPAFTIANGANNGGWGVATDASSDLFVSYTATNTVVEYKPPYTSAAATISNGVDQPRGISVDHSGNLFVSNINSTVTEYAPPYTGTPVTINTVSTGGTYPWMAALSP